MVGGCDRESVGGLLWAGGFPGSQRSQARGGWACGQLCLAPHIEVGQSKGATVSSRGTPPFSGLPCVWGAQVAHHHQPLLLGGEPAGPGLSVPFQP